jgi:O-antigen ligase
MKTILLWWERCLIFALLLSLTLVGTGGIEFSRRGFGISAWSVSRTTFFFWIVYKLLLLIRHGLRDGAISRWRPMVPLLSFFIAVTASLLPNFRHAGDYRYFFFACAHALMLVDLFSALPQRRLLPVVLGIVPLVAVLRGLVHNPAVFIFDLSQRFGYPFDHANTAGFLFAMSIPLSLTIAMERSGWWRIVSLVSCVNQVLALILTFSRGAWLGWTAAMLSLTVALKKWRYLATLAAILGVGVVAFPFIQHRIAAVHQPHQDPAIRERLLLLNSALELGREHPLLGVGYGRGRLKVSLRPYLMGTEFEAFPILHAHNVYAELFAGTGLLGLLAFLWLIVHILLRLWRHALDRNGTEQLVGFGLVASWIGAIVAGFGDVPFYHHETRIFLFSLIAIAYCFDSGTEGKKFNRTAGDH